MRPGPTPNPTKKKKFVIATIVIVIAALVAILIVKHSVSSPDSASNDEQTPAQAEAINGMLVDPAVAKQRPIGVIIENHPDARPQSGLNQADIVYETLAEGGITRYFALFQTQAATNIGPVRSLRTYFGEIADGWRALLVHVGGNNIALDRLRNGAYKNASDADQYFNDKYFHRISTRPAPHNVYTSVDQLRELMTARKYDQDSTNQNWMFKDDSPAAQVTAKTITIPFSTPSFTASFKYDPVANDYYRYLAGKADRDPFDEMQLQPKNVIVQYVKSADLPSDAIGTISLDLSGTGKALVFHDGLVITATWKRTDGFTRYYDSTGQEVKLNRGQIWVDIVPTNLETAVKWTAS